MLRVNVGLSRKITRDYNSTGYSVNLDGEITASTDNPNAVVNQVQDLYKLAEQALALEIDRDQGEDAIGRRDEEPADNGQRNGSSNQPPPSRPSSNGNGRGTNGNGAHNGNGQPEPASNKQVQYLLTLGKRAKMSTPQLEGHIEQVLGRRSNVYGLTKKEAGTVIESLTQNGQA